jgi:hypothetical protein
MKARRSAPALFGGIVWVTASLVGCVSVANTAAADPGPVVHVSTQLANVGQMVQITGSGWSPEGQMVQMELCGQNALDLSNDCDQANQYSAAIRAGGVFYGALTVHLPPVPCPCVVEVSALGGLSGVNAPITIVGAPTAAVPPPAAPVAPVELSAKLQTPVSVSAWFGGPKRVTLVLRVTNLSHIEYESPALSVNVGKGPNPSDLVVGETMAPLAAGATRVLRIPVTIPAFTAGHYSVRAQVITGQGQVATVAKTSSYPWALIAIAIVIALVILQFILIKLRNRVRGRLDRDDAAFVVDIADQPDTVPSPTVDHNGDAVRPTGVPEYSESDDLQARNESLAAALSQAAAERALKDLSNGT